MWIRDHYKRLINTDNVVYLECHNKNTEKKTETKLWTIVAHILDRDGKRYYTPKTGKVLNCGITLWLTEGFADKDEAEIRMERIAEGLANNVDIIDLD
tara:strand:+ start:544 stop:837 length:294 start_codon:yes stop_codon:yes gene_type:complete